MPRVYTAVKSTRGRTYGCNKCGKPIAPGQQYHEWGFRYGGTYRQHAECGRPTRSQLTQSKLGALYDAQDGFDAASYSSPSDLAEGMREVAETAREIAGEYRDAVEAMNMSGSGNENEERADSLESYADELESAADDIDGEEFEAAEPEDCETCAGTGQGNEQCATCEGSGQKATEEYPDATCPDCDGSGETEADCPECDGTGKQPAPEDPVNEDDKTEEEFMEELRDKAIDAVGNCDL